MKKYYNYDVLYKTVLYTIFYMVLIGLIFGFRSGGSVIFHVFAFLGLNYFFEYRRFKSRQKQE